MTAVFADTFYFLAYLNRADANHAAALAATKQARGRLVTTTWKRPGSPRTRKRPFFAPPGQRPNS
jgi:hypothetical protein